MTCSNCKSTVSRVRFAKGQERCANCGGFSEAGGTRTDGILSRQRTRDQGVRHEGDTVNPWAYSKAERKFVPNEDFIRAHGGNSQNFFTPKDLERTHPKLASEMGKARETQPEVGHQGSQAEAQKALLN